jgi:uncharacterized membrane protein
MSLRNRSSIEPVAGLTAAVSMPGPIAAHRLVALDDLRGLIMILMALDHASFFIAKTHSSEYWGTALPVYESALSFLTRWATHICAPGFFFLMGAGMVLFAEARRRIGWNEARILRFFMVRGLLLIVLPFLLEDPVWGLGFRSTTPGAFVFRGGRVPGGGEATQLFFGVLYALGAAMILGAFLRRLGSMAVLLVSALAILTTELITPGVQNVNRLYPALVRLLFIPGHTDWIHVLYPVIPWLGISGFGMILGRALVQRRRLPCLRLIVIGLGLLLIFSLLRLAGGFGNLHPPQAGWIGFLNVTKYPPSLAFVTLTVGLNLILLGLFAKLTNRVRTWDRPLLVFGRSPLFFYFLHLYIYCLIGLALPNGTSLPVLYPIWIAGLAFLYPLCLWYGRFKQSRPIDSLWRLF